MQLLHTPKRMEVVQPGFPGQAADPGVLALGHPSAAGDLRGLGWGHARAHLDARVSRKLHCRGASFSTKRLTDALVLSQFGQLCRFRDRFGCRAHRRALGHRAMSEPTEEIPQTDVLETQDRALDQVVAGGCAEDRDRERTTHARKRVLAFADEHHITVAELHTGEILSVHLIEPDKTYWRNQNREPGRWPSSQN
jgi:hypothetical protein